MLEGPNVTAPILAVEDDETEAVILRMSFAKIALPNKIIVLGDGREAVDYLSGEGDYADRAAHPLPGLLLLDLRMPRMDGFEVLEWLSQQPQFADLPVIVLSASCHDADNEKALQMGAWEFYSKPVSFHQTVKLVRNLVDRWLSGRDPAREKMENSQRQRHVEQRFQ